MSQRTTLDGRTQHDGSASLKVIQPKGESTCANSLNTLPSPSRSTTSGQTDPSSRAPSRHRRHRKREKLRTGRHGRPSKDVLPSDDTISLDRTGHPKERDTSLHFVPNSSSHQMPSSTEASSYSLFSPATPYVSLPSALAASSASSVINTTQRYFPDPLATSFPAYRSLWFRPPGRSSLFGASPSSAYLSPGSAGAHELSLYEAYAAALAATTGHATTPAAAAAALFLPASQLDPCCYRLNEYLTAAAAAAAASHHDMLHLHNPFSSSGPPLPGGSCPSQQAPFSTPSPTSLLHTTCRPPPPPHGVQDQHANYSTAPSPASPQTSVINTFQQPQVAVVTVTLFCFFVSQWGSFTFSYLEMSCLVRALFFTHSLSELCFQKFRSLLYYYGKSHVSYSFTTLLAPYGNFGRYRL